MKLQEMKLILSAHPMDHVRFTLPGGERIAPHLHVTEVGHVVKNFVDCGGTTRRTEACMLQTWIGPDADHRLTAEKLGVILALGGSVVSSDELDVEVEYDGCVISQYSIESSGLADGQLNFQLASKHTDCLAKERCGIGEDSCCSSPTAAACC